MTSTEMCDLLGVNPRTFRRWRTSGYAPEPEGYTPCGYGLWSPTQQRELIKKRTNT